MTRQSRVSLRRLLHAVLVFLAVGSAQPLPAQTNASPGALPVNRFLLIVETSHEMQRRSDVTLQTVNALIASRMRGQLRLNDSIGVWTFNEALYTGKLPLQEWSEGGRTAIASKIFDFLQEQKYEKQGQLDKLMPAVLKVVKNSQFITVILISDGSQEMHGTPFDDQINQRYKQWTAQQQKSRMPFVTVLRAQRGQFTNYSVTAAPWPVDMPPLPEELVKPKAPPSLPVVSAPKPAPPPMAPPLIISGRKPAPAPAVTTNTSLVQASSPGANADPGAPAAQKKQPDAATTASAPTVPDQRLSEPAPGNATLATLSPPLAQTPGASLESKSASKPSQAPPPSETSSAPQTTERQSPPVASLSNPPANRLDAQPTTQRSDAAAATDIATTPPAPATSLAKLIGLGLVLVVSVVGMSIWIWKRRRRPSSHASLITRSLDRDQH